MTAGPFTVGDFRTISGLAIEAWRAGAEQDWTVPAGTLEWSCWTTADHTVDCVFSYAVFLASRKQDAYPLLGEVHAPPEATPHDLVNNLETVCRLLVGTIEEAPPGTRAILYRRPEVTTGDRDEFAARGALELSLHTHDISTGLGVPFHPPADLAERLREAVRDWKGGVTPRTDDPWSDLLERSGRARL